MILHGDTLSVLQTLPEASVPCVVLDPFSGSGSTGVAAERLLLKYIGIELGASYVDMAERRIGAVAPLFAESP